MKTEPQFVEIPRELAELIGQAEEGTRIFRNEGDHFAMQRWFYAICEFIGPCVSPGGAAVQAGVTRAGVYKRMKAGKLTAFCFHITGKKKTLFGGEKKLKQFPVVYIPVSECKAWDEELSQRVARIEASKPVVFDSDDEAALAEADPGIDDPDHSFLNYDPKDKGKKVAYRSLFTDPHFEIPRPSLDELGAYQEQLREEERTRKEKSGKPASNPEKTS